MRNTLILCGVYEGPRKIHFFGRDMAQIVTNLCVNKRLRPTRAFIGKVKSDLWLCLDQGPHVLADVEGLARTAVKNRLLGRIAHIQTADAAVGKELKGLFFGIDWKSPPPVCESQLDASESVPSRDLA